jgi:sortase A
MFPPEEEANGNAAPASGKGGPKPGSPSRGERWVEGANGPGAVTGALAGLTDTVRRLFETPFKSRRSDRPRWGRGYAKPTPSAPVEFRATATKARTSEDRGTKLEIRRERLRQSARALLPARQAEQGPDPDRRVLRLGLALVTVGACLLLFLAYLFVFTGLQEQRQQRLLLNVLTTPAGAVVLSGKAPPEGQPTGVLTIPAIGLHQVVVEGSSATDLLKGPGSMIGTARPGTKGNAVIAGHRSIAGAPFANLTKVRLGDRITVVTGLGKFHYEVTTVGTAPSGTTDPISPSNHAMLTLVTGNPAVVTTGRYYVQAKLLGAPATAPIPTSPPSSSQRGLGGDTGAIWPSILWGVALAVGLVATFAAYRRWRQRLWTVYLLTTPILLALALIWFQNLTRLLPATM